jgi:8-amino-7-oxononanoate synthase
VPSPLYDRIARDLDARQHGGQLRSIPNRSATACEGMIDLSTNSYLALHQNGDVAAAAHTIAGDALHGNLASRLIADTSPAAATLESELAAWKGCEAALLFNSGYAANLGVLQALATRDTEIFCDRLNHASIIDGIRLSGARLTRYRHGDMTDLRGRLAASRTNEKIIVTDTVFSMDGDCAPLADIATIGKEHSCFIMVDEAHATGIFGAHASGLVEQSGTAEAIDVRIGTLSKAIAGVGGFFAGTKLLRDYFVNTARSLIFSTGLPHAGVAFDLAAVRHLRAHPELGATLLRRATAFRDQVERLGFKTGPTTTQIVPCITGDETTALDIQTFLRERGIVAPAIRPPTVPGGTARIRFSVHLGLTDDDIVKLLDALAEWKRRHG